MTDIIDHRNWWRYYGFTKEPELSLNPLIQENDFRVFFGREEEIKKLETYATGAHVKCILVVGTAGIGKTSLTCKQFSEYSGFIYVDLSQAKSMEYAYEEIAYACITHLRKMGLKWKDLDKKLKRNIATTRGRGLIGTLLGIGGSTKYERTITPERQYVVRDVVVEILGRTNKAKKDIAIILDETDHVRGGNTDDLLNLCGRIKSQLRGLAILVLNNRDKNDTLYKGYHDSESLVSSIFSDILVVESLWRPGKGDIGKILEPRFYGQKPQNGVQIPIGKKAQYWIDILSSGNIRDMLRLTRNLLRAGQAEKAKTPLREDFCLEHLKSEFRDADLGDEIDRRILEFLNKKPMSSSDEEFVRAIGVDRTTILRRLKPLEKAWFVERKVVDKKSGKTEYYTTPRYEKLAEWST